MGLKIIIFILLFTAFLSFFNLDMLAIFRRDRFFNRDKAKRKNAVNTGGRGSGMNGRRGAGMNGRRGAGKIGGTNVFYGQALARYRIKMDAVLKYSAFDAGVDGLLRIKILLAVMGLIAGVLIKNPFLCVVLCAGLFWLPDAYFRISSVRFAKEADDAVETAMGIVTNSYLQSEDIKNAIFENITRIGQPLREVFREFLAETGFVDASVQNALYRMKLKTDNAFFADWCDILIQCQDDRELKYVLPSIVTKLNSVKRMQMELDTAMYDIYKEFIYVVGIVTLNMPLMFLINAEWAKILFGTPVGKLTVAACFAVIFGALAYVVSVNRSLVRMTD